LAYNIGARILKAARKKVPLAAVVIGAVLPQLFIGRVGFETAGPILLGVLIVLVVIIAAVEK